MKNLFLTLIILPLMISCSAKEKIQVLPDAEFAKPYSVKINFSDGNRTYPKFFDVMITPLDSGLSASKVIGEWDNETIIFGTPKVRQDISIKIRYVIRGPVGFFEDDTKENFYLIKVK